MIRPLLYACALAGIALAASCGSDDEESPSGTGGSAGDPTPPGSCVRPGDKGNDKGVGEYCTPTGKECSGFPEAPLCLASVGQEQWMCTRIGCDATTDCGEGAGCLLTSQGSACVPCRCDDQGIGCADAGSGDAG